MRGGRVKSAPSLHEIRFSSQNVAIQRRIKRVIKVLFVCHGRSKDRKGRGSE